MEIVGEIIVYIFLELLIKGTGKLIGWLLLERNSNSFTEYWKDSKKSTRDGWIGLLFWVSIILLISFL